jgi:anti-anti-sigma regulatory factor
MPVHNLSEEIFQVSLSTEPQLGGELRTLNTTIRSGDDRDAVIDFACVEMLTSESICDLMILNKTLHEVGRRLVMYNVPAVIMSIFERTGLDQIFEFAESRIVALEAVQGQNEQ